MSNDVERRVFLELASKGIVAAAGLASCASIPVFTTSAVDGRVTVDLAQFPDLKIPGKGIVVRAEQAAEPIILLATDGGQVRALSGVCTHLACSVRLGDHGLSCPCHGSTFSLEGRVTRGPAPDDLHTFPTTLAGNTVVITLN